MQSPAVEPGSIYFHSMGPLSGPAPLKPDAFLEVEYVRRTGVETAQYHSRNRRDDDDCDNAEHKNSHINCPSNLSPNMASERIRTLPVGMGVMSTGALLTAREMLKLRYPFAVVGIDDPGIDLKGGVEIATEKHDFDDENGFSVRRV